MRTTKTLLLLALLLLLLAPAARAQLVDGDGDGVEDALDLCPAEDASLLDGDGDGCIDPFSGARHLEFWDPADLPLSYVIHENGAPILTDGSDFAAIQAGFDRWTQVPDVQLSAQYDGFFERCRLHRKEVGRRLRVGERGHVSIRIRARELSCCHASPGAKRPIGAEFVVQSLLHGFAADRQ